MKRGWQLVTLGFLALFVFAIWKSTSLPLKDSLGPGPGFFPLWLGAVGSALAVLLFIEVTRQRESGPTFAELIPDRGALARIAAVIVLLVATALALEPIGYRITALVFTVLLLPALGARSLPAIAILGAAGSFGVFHVFYHWLKVPLPIGSFGL